jgi:hypothetical protein
MEVKTTEIDGKRYVLRRMDNSAWEFAKELTEQEWTRYCERCTTHNKVFKERRRHA